MNTVQVKNGSTLRLIGRFDGRDYLFPPGGMTSLPEDAANHIFALRQDNKTGALNRLGILKPGVSMEEALAVLDKLSFSKGRVVFEDSQPLSQPDTTDIGGNLSAHSGPGGDAGTAVPANPRIPEAYQAHLRQTKRGG
jgi:hypothetical protein